MAAMAKDLERPASGVRHVRALDEARNASVGGNWQKAYDVLAEAGMAGMDAEGLALLADAAYACGHPETTIAAWERAYSIAMKSGDRMAAAGAAVKVSLHLLMDTGLMAPVRGWTRRVQKLLEGADETPVHAWLAVVCNYERMLSGDYEEARQWARIAIDVGTRCAPAAAAVGRLAEARSLVLEGDVSGGLAMLNDTALAALSGELDPLATGIVYCEVICAFQALGQHDLAEEWTMAMERWHEGQPVGSIHGRCRVHRAELLRWRGSALEAELEILAACEELRPYLWRELGWPLTELGRIRLQLGDVAGAEEAFLAAHGSGWDAQPGLALVQLARGHVTAAAESIADALAHPRAIPSKERPPNTELRRAPLLEAQVEIEAVAGNIERAESALNELEAIAGRYGSKTFSAGAFVARGRLSLALGDHGSARLELEHAVSLWGDIGAPYQAARARLLLAEALMGEGREAQAELEIGAAKSTFERVGSAGEAALAAARIAQLRAGDITPVVQPSIAAMDNAADHTIANEGEYWSVTFDGHTIRLRDQRGLHHLARLLGEPGREFHAIALAADSVQTAVDRQFLDADLSVRAATNAGPILDDVAKDSYRRRLAEIEEDMDEARSMGDVDRVEQAMLEREFLIKELSRAVGLGGRDRQVSSNSERARVSVTRAIRHAISRLEQHDAALAEHLTRTIHTGTYCSYMPDSRAGSKWRISSGPRHRGVS